MPQSPAASHNDMEQLEAKEEAHDQAPSDWEEYDITAGTSEMPTLGATTEEQPRTTPRVNESFSQLVSDQVKDGVRLSVSRSVFRSAKTNKG